jgi:hypothetical protein
MVMRQLLAVLVSLCVVACGTSRAWPDGSAEAFAQAIAHHERVSSDARVIIERWSSTWSSAISNQDDFNVALLRLRESKDMATALEALNKEQGSLTTRVQRIHHQWKMPDEAERAPMDAFACTARLVVYARAPTGNLAGFNQATGVLANECAGYAMRARAYLPPPANS